MKKKLINFIMNTRIGHNKMFFIMLVTLFFLGSCLSKEYDYYYRIYFENATNDTLTIVLNDSIINSSIIYNYKIIPNDSICTNIGKNINEGEDIRKKVFSDGKHEHYSIVSVF